MINMKKLLTKILQKLRDSVSKTGDTMTGELKVTSTNARVTVQSSGGYARGRMEATSGGDFGLYDTKNSKWLIRADTKGKPHISFGQLTAINTAKVACTGVGTSYQYTTFADLANFDVVAVLFSVHEEVRLLFFVRGETIERSVTTYPSAGKFRGTIFVDWANNRIAMRCINAGTSNTYANLVNFTFVLGVL